MKDLKRKLAVLLTLCLVLTGAVPAYGEEMTVPVKTEEMSELFAESAETIVPEAVCEEAAEAIAAEAVEAEPAEDEASDEDPAVSAEKPEQAAEILGTDQDPVSYLTWDDTKKELVEGLCTEYTVIDAGTAEPEGGYTLESGKWYVVKGTVTFHKRIQNNAAKDTPAHLILSDGKTFTASAGIRNPESKGLVICGQSAGTGTLTIESVSNNDAAIGGGNGETNGSVTINGGTVTVKGGIDAAGIGGGHDGGGGSITVNGGTVTANGGDYAAGIGGGELGSGDNIVINGGTVTAVGGTYTGAGIGGGRVGAGGNITINGGMVNAVAMTEAAGIGGGTDGDGGNVTINGGTITATGNKAPGIGYGYITPGSSNPPGELHFGRYPAIIKGTDSTGEHTIETKDLENDLQRCTYTSVHLEYQKVDYTVEHWFQQELFKDDYKRNDAETETLAGFVNNDTEAKPKQFRGYKHKSTAQVKIEADKPAVAVVKYDLCYSTISFDLNGHGTAIRPISKVPGADIHEDEPEKPVAEGYLFEGWYTDTDLQDRFIFSLMPSADLTLHAKWTVDPSKWKDVSYVDEDGNIKTVSCIVISVNADSYSFEAGKWYAVTGNVTVSGRMENRAPKDTPAHLILTDGYRLTASHGIRSGSGNGLSIYGQENNEGELIIPGAEYGNAGIGGNHREAGGTLIINGGKLTIRGGERAAAIGSGYFCAAGGSVVINGGTIDVTGGASGLAIGGGADVIVNGGKVTAAGGGTYGGAGIGGGGNVTVTGGEITAAGTVGAAGIESDKTVAIEDGKITAVGGIRSKAEINISGGEITASGVAGGAGIGSGNRGTGVSITISGGRITASGNDGGAGIGGGNGTNGTVTVTGGEIMATGAAGGAGIGGGNSSADGSVTITGGKITAIGTGGGAGIGPGGNSGSFGTVDISSELEILAGISKEECRYQSSALYCRTRDPYAAIHPIPSYTVKHSRQKADGTGYEEAETETIKGHSGEKTEASFKSYEGFMPLSFTQQTVKSDSSTVVEIRYDRLNYTLVFDPNGHGKAPAAITARYGETITKPADPAAEGYIFGGWYEEEACTTPYTFTTMPLGGKTVYAKWTNKVYTKYTVTWMLNDIKLIDTTEVTEGEMPVHENPAMEGYIFIGWQPLLAPVTGNVKYTAYFEKRAEDKVAVTFNTDGGTFINTQVIDRNTAPKRPSDPQKKGCEFEGWYREAGFVTPYEFTEPLGADITLYAKWKTVVRIHTITFKDWDGKTLATVKVEEGGLPKYPGASRPSRSGYNFTGWTPEIDLAYADMTYTATYAPQTVINGGGGGGGSVPAVKKAAVTFSPNWYADAYGVWRIKNSAGQVVTNAWLCDDAVTANGQNVWYLLTQDGAMLASGLVQDNTGNFYSLETNHDGYFGMLRYTDGYYNCNGQQVYLKFSKNHDGTFGAVVNPDGIEKLKAIYGVTKYGIGNENAVYTKTF